MTSETAGAAVASDVEGRIIGFIKSEILFEDPSVRVVQDTPLLEGILDSMALMQLVAFLETEFEVEIEDIDITKTNFASVGTITRLIAQRSG